MTMTPRLRLVDATLALFTAAVAGGSALEELLGLPSRTVERVAS